MGGGEAGMGAGSRGGPRGELGLEGPPSPSRSLCRAAAAAILGMVAREPRLPASARCGSLLSLVLSLPSFREAVGCGGRPGGEGSRKWRPPWVGAGPPSARL